MLMIKHRIKFSDQHYLKTNSEMSELFADLPEALENNYNFPLDVVLDHYFLIQFYQILVQKKVVMQMIF